MVNTSSSEGYSNILYTRAGNFYMDSNGYLVNGDGKYLVGYSECMTLCNYDDPDDDSRCI